MVCPSGMDWNNAKMLVHAVGVDALIDPPHDVRPYGLISNPSRSDTPIFHFSFLIFHFLEEAESFQDNVL